MGSGRDVGYVDPAVGFVTVATEEVEGETALLAFNRTSCTPRGVFFVAQDMLVRRHEGRTTVWRPAPGGGATRS